MNDAFHATNVARERLTVSDSTELHLISLTLWIASQYHERGYIQQGQSIISYQTPRWYVAQYIERQSTMADWL